MVREILEDTFALFALSGFRKSIASGAGGRAPPIARLEFLRSRIEMLEEVADRDRAAALACSAVGRRNGAVPSRGASDGTGDSAFVPVRADRVRNRGYRGGCPLFSRDSYRTGSRCVVGIVRSICRSIVEWRRACACGRRGCRPRRGLLDRSAGAEDPETRSAPQQRGPSAVGGWAGGCTVCAA